jgi:hypothetical protein
MLILACTMIKKISDGSEVFKEESWKRLHAVKYEEPMVCWSIKKQPWIS